MMLLWVDVETTGLDPRVDQILEIAVHTSTIDDPFTTTQVCNEVLCYPSVMLSDFIVGMHTRNGLLPECVKSTLQIEDVEERLLETVPMTGEYGDRPTLVGNSVHFDHGFLKEHMPKLAARLSHRILDVSSILLFCRSLGMPKLPKHEAHRANDDIIESMNLLRQCQVWLKEHYGQKQIVEREVGGCCCGNHGVFSI